MCLFRYKNDIKLKTMKKILVFAVTVLASIATMAQRPTATMDEVNDMLKNSTVYVVLYESPLTDYNSQIRRAVEKYWTATPFEFIYYNNLTDELNNPHNAFLAPVSVQFQEDDDSVMYTFMSLLIGGDYETINDLPEVCSFPLCYESYDDEAAYQFPAIISFMNQHVQAITDDPKLLRDKKFAVYTHQKRSIEGKTIYLLKEEQNEDFDEVAEIKAVCPIANVEFTDQMTLEKIIRRNEADALFVHTVGPVEAEDVPGRAYVALMGADGTLYYFNHHKINAKNPKGMTIFDWKALATHKK